MTPNSIHFVGYKHRHCTDTFCLILFLIFLFIYGLLSILVISQGNPTSLIQASDSLGNLCGQNEFKSQPYQLYFDISKCLTDGDLSFVCPTTKLCVNSCPTYYSDYQSLQTMEDSGYLSRNYTRNQLICMYNFNPIIDNRTIIEIVNDGLCAPYTIPSEPFLDRCLPSVLTNLFEYEKNETLKTNVSVEQINTQMIGINSISDVGQIIFSDLYQIKESLALFILLACILTLLYMFVVKQLTGLVVYLTMIVLLLVLFICSSYCWFTIYTGDDLVYEYSTVARIVNDFIKLRTIYYIFGCIRDYSAITGSHRSLNELTENVEQSSEWAEYRSDYNANELLANKGSGWIGLWFHEGTVGKIRWKNEEWKNVEKKYIERETLKIKCRRGKISKRRNIELENL